MSLNCTPTFIFAPNTPSLTDRSEPPPCPPRPRCWAFEPSNSKGEGEGSARCPRPLGLYLPEDKKNILKIRS